MVAGDFNTDLGEEKRGLDHLCSECNLIDPILTTPGAADFSTYNHGKNILDYILIDQELLPTIVRCGYEAFHAHVISDHRGVYIDVDTDLFFGVDPQVLSENKQGTSSVQKLTKLGLISTTNTNI
ncbi:unknown protein [Seminavis robusta]|uniref:Endonuclease/exonuclease/phosphatase domain-containing protein n=1 Tax=Seminavis robusta TaxID=568900 RepID=A0A9N8F196_9STRA|nr:unknown protein [Seminavis robusta]|eukprot:Sro3196_g344990.1 n/a (125) ;mRNA; f:1298-1672